MREEEIDSNQLMENIIRFTNLGNEHGVNNWLLRGNSSGGGIPEVYAGCFPRLYAPIGGLVVVTPVTQAADRNLSRYYKDIFGLTIPDDAVIIADDKPIRDGLETIVSAGSLPSIALVLGRSGAGHGKVAVLYAIVGVSAQTALSEIQRGLQRGMANQN